MPINLFHNTILSPILKGSLLLFLLGVPGITAQAQQDLKSPSNFLGYPLGEQFSRHHRIVDYFNYLDDNSDWVEIRKYGETYESRPLIYAIVGKPEYLDHIEQIRKRHLAGIGLANEQQAADNDSLPLPVITWLSYNVHGNEASPSEVAMNTIYKLATSTQSNSEEWLENTIVIIDPALNPDGRERYVQWYRGQRGKAPNADPLAREHEYSWPNGRTNHYYFDLNRDWAWQVQKESKARVAAYNRWRPHIHVDYHEQSYNEPYYFAPASRPFHRAITQWQIDFQKTVGQNNARAFDEQGWLYFTGEGFDLFYPSYGDTWPLFNGAIGMTYEQGGITAGLAVETNGGDTLTLAERIDHHTVSGLATVRTASENHERLKKEFRNFFNKTAEQGNGPYGGYVIRGSNSQQKLEQIQELLDTHQIRYGRAGKSEKVEAVDYSDGKKATIEVQPNDLVVSTHQPQGRMARVLLQPEPKLTDSLTYDITAWALPYAYGVEAYALQEEFKPASGQNEDEASASSSLQHTDLRKPYAYIVPWETVHDTRFLSALLKQGFTVRYTARPFETKGKEFGRGSLIVARKNNERRDRKFDSSFRELAGKYNRAYTAVATGMMDKGPDLGSSDIKMLDKPEVAVLAEPGVSQYSLGEIWHFFDRQIDYPAPLFTKSSMNADKLYRYDVLILPDGVTTGVAEADGKLMSEIKEWVSRGGRLIAIQGAVEYLSGLKDFDLGIQSVDNKEEMDSLDHVHRLYGERRREAISERVTGAVFKVRMDTTHPLGYGLARYYYSLKLDARAYRPLEKGWNAGVLEENSLVSGFVGAEAGEELKNTLVYGAERYGDGSVVYLVDNPLFRGFWYNGKLLFSNAVFMWGE